jgi:hypothetical protein
MTPQEMLSAATGLFNQPPASMLHCWQRACATLTRTALEKQLQAYWLGASPTLARCPLRHQLLALPIFVEPEVAATARSAWYGLSRAVHHHTYELPPTLAELVSWHDDVTGLMPALSRPQR